MKNENSNNENLENNETCPAIGYQAITVGVPVSITPFAHTGATATTCCGKPVVRSGSTVGSGVKNGVCNFTISQNIVVAVPVAFGAEAVVGDTYVDCVEASADELECDSFNPPAVE